MWYKAGFSRPMLFRYFRTLLPFPLRPSGWAELPGPAKRAVFVAALVTVFLAAHLPFLAPGAGSIDAMNFALAVRDFDVSDHRPHAPGYPVFVALGKITRALLSSAPEDASSVQYEARALAIWSALFGGFAVLPLFAIFRSLELDDRRAAAATALTVTCPLFWFMAVRPMSDMPGLGAALVAQALVFVAARRQERDEWANANRLLVAAAAIAGLAIGLRSQTVWLTAPVLAVASVRQIRAPGARAWRSAAWLVSAAALGIAIWAVPLVAASGGPSSYLSALDLQAGDDFTDVDMLIRHPTAGRLARGLVSTFAYPWADKYLAAVILVLATIGLVRTALEARRVLGWLALASGPYTLFHLLYQDPIFTRYALPVIPVAAYLAVTGLHVFVPRAMPWLAGVVAAFGLVIAGRPVLAYATVGGPGYQTSSAVRHALSEIRGARPVLAAHHEVGRAIRGERFDAGALPFPRRHEWLEVVKYWREGGTAPVWFLADSGRTDLALIDPSVRRLRATFQLPFTNRFFMSGARPSGVSWYEIGAPGWMAGEGWALTPETAGVAWRDARGPALMPITAWLRRRPEAAVMVIGGRNLTNNSGGYSPHDISFTATLDGRPLASWKVGPELPGFFLQTIDLPAGSLEGDGRYATLAIAARSADGVIRRIDAAIEQFDVQSADRPVFGFDTGWYQLEYDAAARRLWRWTGPWADVLMHHGGRDVTMRIAGDSPLKYQDRVPAVVVRAGDRVLSRLNPAADFVAEVRVPADALTAAGGRVTIETDTTFVPDDRLHNGDRRPLGLRIFEVTVQ